MQGLTCKGALWKCRWSDPSIKVGDVLVMIDGIEPASLGEALQMLTGPKGSLVIVQTEGGSGSFPRDSRCSLGNAAPSGPAPAAFGPTGGLMTPAECTSLGLPVGSRWGSSKGGGETSFVSI